MINNKFIRYILHPKEVFLRIYMEFLKKHDLKKLADIIYQRTFGKKINWDNPQNLSEKINWMKFHSDTSLWTEYADKYKVREYIKHKGLDKILVKLYGVWEKAEDINFDELPNSFVLKTNHACGTVLLVKDKAKLNIKDTTKILSKWMSMKMGIQTAEPHYLGIKPLIIAEEYLQTESGDPIIDYKLYTVCGETELVMVCSDRKIGIGSSISLYDKNWNYCPEKLGNCLVSDKQIAKPNSFEKMKEYAKILGEDFPFVRIDFYDINGKVYFGEMTFTPKGGYTSSLSDEEQLRIGLKIDLSKINKIGV